jgi:chorismate-pyruvate lyase
MLQPSSAPHDRPAPALRPQVEDLARELSNRLLAACSATATLCQWCNERGLGWGDISIVRRPCAAGHLAHDWVLDELRPDRGQSVAYRRVCLMRGKAALSEADNWFVPERLTPNINHILDWTDVPFGTAIKSLEPRRRTLFVEFAQTSADPEPDEGDAGPEPASTPCIFEHRAVVLRRDGTPIAVVREAYLPILVTAAGSRLG